MMQQVCISVVDGSQVGEARRAGTGLAGRAGLGETESGKVGIVVTELATNLVRYGKKGRILMRGVEGERVEVLAIDEGPGMDVGKCLRDGFSTGGTPGNGLGAVRRLAGEFDVYSVVDGGTVVYASVWAGNGNGGKAAGRMRWGCVNLPAPGETVCGDSYAVREESGVVAMMVVDGLGHGPEAAKAAEAALEAFAKEPLSEPVGFVQAAHRAMAGTRGAAVAMARLDGGKGILRYAGVGNIAGTLFGSAGAGGERRGLVSHNGIVGAMLPRVQGFEHPLEASGMVVMHSDGLQTRWNLGDYAGLGTHHPAVIAGVLYRDFCRGRDDVTVLVGVWQGGLS